MPQERETLEVPREIAGQVSEYAGYLQSGALRDPETAPAMAAELSYYGQSYRPRNFMHPEVAARFGQRGGRYLGPKGKAAMAKLRFNQPQLAELRIDPLLTQISVAHRNDELIGRSIFPTVQVDQPSGTYFVFDAAPWFRDEGLDMVRGLWARAARVGYTLSTDRYKVETYAVEIPIDDRQRAAADAAVGLDARHTQFVTDKIDLRVEQIIHDIVFTAANWTGGQTLAGTTQWSHASSNPFLDMSTARLAIRTATGARPNTMVMGIQVFETLALHAGLIDRVKYTGTQDQPAMVTASMMAALFGMERVLIGGAIKNTLPERMPDAMTAAFIWEDKVWVGYVPDAPARETPAAGYIFSMGRFVDRYREEAETSDYIRCQEELDVQQTSAGAGYLFSDVLL